MIHSRIFSKRVLFFCCLLTASYAFCEAVSIDQEYNRPDDKTTLVLLSELEAHPAPEWEVGIEALIFKTDLANSANFEVAGFTSYKKDEFGIKPLVGTQVSYQGKCFNTMDELVDYLKSDSGIEVLGFAKELCTNNMTVRMFDDVSNNFEPRLPLNALEGLLVNREKSVSLETVLCLKPEIVKDWRVDLTLFIQKAELKTSSSSDAEQDLCSYDDASVLLSKNRYTVGSMPVPDRFFAIFPRLAFEGENEPKLEGSPSSVGDDVHNKSLDQRCIVLILRPVIFKE